MENQTVNNNDEVEIDLGEVVHVLLSKLIRHCFLPGGCYGNHAFYHTEV